ncbi:cytochrome c550 [Bacillus solitudinis]|uniref:cytochrome c550 n=1 Tax=Bacillus solitudinis TaxID=2014074 RepID=UPI000C24853A|nr:cytochrome c [Bacillus solitudinis]
MKGRPLVPFAITAIIGILLMISLSFVGLNQRAEMNADEPEAEEEVTEFEDPVAAGEELAGQSCIACHGADLTGSGGPDLTALEGKYSQEEIAGIIQNGQGAMPPQTNLNSVEADAIAQFLLSNSQ